jgi:hypothetical protein
MDSKGGRGGGGRRRGEGEGEDGGLKMVWGKNKGGGNSQSTPFPPPSSLSPPFLGSGEEWGESDV